MVAENPHMSYEMTGGMDAETFGGAENDDELVRKWDLSYKVRSRKYGAFLTCGTEFLELYNPPILTDDFMMETFGRIPPTSTPPPVTLEQFQAILKVTD
jgi:hypothetical protein